jgi:hypothetical protein
MVHPTSPMSCNSLHKYLHKQSLLNWDGSSEILKAIVTINEVPSEYEVCTSSTSIPFREKVIYPEITSTEPD